MCNYLKHPTILMADIPLSGPHHSLECRETVEHEGCKVTSRVRCYADTSQQVVMILRPVARPGR